MKCQRRVQKRWQLKSADSKKLKQIQTNQSNHYFLETICCCSCCFCYLYLLDSFSNDYSWLFKSSISLIYPSFVPRSDGNCTFALGSTDQGKGLIKSQRVFAVLCYFCCFGVLFRKEEESRTRHLGSSAWEWNQLFPLASSIERTHHYRA